MSKFENMLETVLKHRHRFGHGWQLMKHDGMTVLETKPGTYLVTAFRYCHWCPGCDTCGPGLGQSMICPGCELEVENTWIEREATFTREELEADVRATVDRVARALTRGMSRIEGGQVKPYVSGAAKP